jgi:hypothetical protein
LIWLTVHLFYLIGFQNRLLVVLRWGFSFITRGRGARLITNDAPARPAEDPGEAGAASRTAQERVTAGGR